jgi:hypothetical protein
VEIFFVSDVNFDLLGDPIPEGFGKRGRPPHVPTDEKRLKVRVLLAFTGDEEEVAAGIGISVPTLRKHYFRELRDKLSARRQLKATLLYRLAEQSEQGNASAIEKLFKRIDKLELVELQDAVSNRGKDKPEKLGKKDQARRDAGAVTGKFAPPPPLGGLPN